MLCCKYLFLYLLNYICISGEPVNVLLPLRITDLVFRRGSQTEFLSSSLHLVVGQHQVTLHNHQPLFFKQLIVDRSVAADLIQGDLHLQAVPDS